MSTHVLLRAILYTTWKLHELQCWLQNLLSASPVVNNMEKSFPLQDFSAATTRCDATMSRRRISVKELGKVDCHGWLYKKKESRAFLGNKWKKYWFVLKESSLYWYNGVLAEKAEGYINLRDFSLEQAQECRRKFAIKASHPQVVTLFFAAENTHDMHKWLSKLTIASSKKEPVEVVSTECLECYSEASDDEDEVEESVETGAQSTEQLTASSINGRLPPPRSCSSPSRAMLPLESPVCNTECVSSDSESWLELSMDSDCPSVSVSEEPDVGRLQDYRGDDRPPSDELEMLYLHLKHASLSLCGAPQLVTKRDYRSSFVRRCKDDAVNEKLHLVRALNSTLKAKETDLLSIEQILSDSDLDASKYRQWRSANVLLMEEISQKSRTEEKNTEPGLEQTPSPTPLALDETCL